MNDFSSVKGKVAVVTGVTSGLGRQWQNYLHQMG